MYHSVEYSPVEYLVSLYLFVFHVTKDNSKYGRKHSETMVLSKEGEKQRLMK